MSIPKFEVDQDLEQKIFEGLASPVEEVYERHMTAGLRKDLDIDEEPGTGIIHPLREMYIAAQLEPLPYISNELVDAVRTSHQDRMKFFADRGLDAEHVIAETLHMNLGTEDNTVWYHARQWDHFRQSGPFARLLNRWTAEELKHGPFIELYMMLAGIGSPDRATNTQASLVMGGISVATHSTVAINAFTDPQEADTVDAHQDLGSVLDPIGRRVMNRLAGQEAVHNRDFRALGKALYELDQDIIEYALPIEAEVHGKFAMPGSNSYPDFKEAALLIASRGLFTLEGIVARQRERVEDIGLLNLQPKTEPAKKSLDRIEWLIDWTHKLNKMKQKAVDTEQERYIKEEKEAGRVPFILGKTVVIDKKDTIILPDAA